MAVIFRPVRFIEKKNLPDGNKTICREKWTKKVPSFHKKQMMLVYRRRLTDEEQRARSREGENALLCSSHEKFHTVVFPDAKIISGSPYASSLCNASFSAFSVPQARSDDILRLEAQVAAALADQEAARAGLNVERIDV